MNSYRVSPIVILSETKNLVWQAILSDLDPSLRLRMTGQKFLIVEDELKVSKAYREQLDAKARAVLNNK
ncbi:MAG: hypothetical protein EXS55_01785 [Candidatus Magasanikbacteria bacterium]|nr:hypothetical protein [Candidatus Magasanikbacteria bacterium]